MRRFFPLALVALSLLILTSQSEAQRYRQTFRSPSPSPLRSPTVPAFNPYSTPYWGINYYWNSPANVSARLVANQNFQNYSQALNSAVATQAAVSMNPWSYYGYYPYAYSPYSYNPYSYPSSSYSPSYGYSAPYSSSYGSAPGYGAAPVANPYMNPPAVAAAPAQQPSTLAVYGIPHEKGHVQWPQALRLMPADKKRDLLDPLDAQLQIITLQAVSGRTNPTLLKEAHAKVHDARQWLRSREPNLAQGIYRDADDFLGRIDAALDRMHGEY